MSTAEPRLTLLDRVFYVSLILKGLDGVLELIGGVLLLVVTPAQIGAIARFLTLHELSEDPRDFIANTVLNLVDGLNVSVALFGAIYLLLGFASLDGVRHFHRLPDLPRIWHSPG